MSDYEAKIIIFLKCFLQSTLGLLKKKKFEQLVFPKLYYFFRFFEHCELTTNHVKCILTVDFQNGHHNSHQISRGVCYYSKTLTSPEVSVKKQAQNRGLLFKLIEANDWSNWNMAQNHTL